MKARIITLSATLFVVAAVFAPIAQAGFRFP